MKWRELLIVAAERMRNQLPLLKNKNNHQPLPIDSSAMQPQHHKGADSGTPPLKRVAIVGSGIAGLTSAWLLGRDGGFHVTLIESEQTLGMDAHSFDMAQPGAARQRLDMPLRVFSESYYPNLTRLYTAAGVSFCPEDYCGSFFDTDGDCLFKYSNFLIGPYSLPLIFPRFLFRRKPLALAFEYIRFMVAARRHTKDGSVWLRVLETMTFGEYLQRGGFSAPFIHKFIVRLPNLHVPPMPLLPAQRAPVYYFSSSDDVSSGTHHPRHLHMQLRCGAGLSRGHNPYIPLQAHDAGRATRGARHSPRGRGAFQRCQ